MYDKEVVPSAALRLRLLQQHLSAAAPPPLPLTCAATKAATNAAAAAVDDSKLCTAEEAAALIPDGAWLTFAGFVGTGCPELLLNAVRERFDACGAPSRLGLIFAASVGNSKGRGADQLSAEGLVDRLIYGWTGTAPGFLKLVRENKVQAWNIPLGIVSHMIRDVAAGRAGPLTKVGLGTFVDPREKGGKLNSRTTRDVVKVVQLGGKELLWYQPPAKIDVALLRGTSADLDGNVSFEREALFCDQLNQAMAAHNSGGLVVVQVERIVERGTLPPRAVHLPGALVDRIVVAPPELHWQSFREPGYDGSLSGEIRTPLHSIAPLPVDERRVIAHRAMLEIDRPNSIVNLGVGMPEGVAVMVATHSHQNKHAASVTLTTEAGAFGGIPGGGMRFGSSHNASCLVPTASQIDFYAGGGVDLAVLGMAEVDASGNVNVSNFPGRMPGCGGFIDISQNAKKLLFVGTFTGGGLKLAVEAGKLAIRQEGRLRKFKTAVQEKTFAGSSGNSRTIMYITERAVFRLTSQQQQQGGGGGGHAVELLEVAPGVDIDKDILPLMDFRPIMRGVRQMPAICFQP
ncbi:transferase [Micractinium conductrix]|uniref:Succinyl-CoA:3-ketoacid-coenzyme A transferase n=1 Tax=Micractinium conductrix TaxID=554055 RepID=A0A2P6VL32_9CHLO|nr:transferase [Micractinium conductrix]|eukprot:PSC74812.1 transferase [Micractinium conductrix]